MNKITHISGKVMPLAMNDVDTDMIIPAQFLTSVSTLGFGENVFRRLRDSDPNFPFNQQKFSDAHIMVTQENFGCGSSREHAVWALVNAGIEAIIAESFADIFYNNASKNGLVLIKQPAHIIVEMIAHAKDGDYTLDIDIAENMLKDKNGQSYPFELDPFHRHCFLNGLDHMDYLLSYKDVIHQWNEKRHASN